MNSNLRHRSPFGSEQLWTIEIWKHFASKALEILRIQKLVYFEKNREEEHNLS